MKRYIISLLVFWTLAQFSVKGMPLDSLFASPPQEAKPLIIWQWMDGVVSREGITADLKAYKEAGLGGVQQFLIGGPLQGEIRDTTNAIGTENWKRLMRHAIMECQRLGLSFGTHNCPGWSSSGFTTVRPEDSMQKLVWTDTILSGGHNTKLNMPRPKVDPRWNYYQDIALLAWPADSVISIGQVLNLTGHKACKLPNGRWRIVRFGHTTNGKTNGNNAAYGGVGLECDKMSRKAVRRFWQSYPSMLLQLAGDVAGKTFSRIEIDSYEAGPQDWTPMMAEEFSKHRGYDLLPWLPALIGQIIGSKEETLRFLKDWEATITDLFAENYYGEMYRLVSETPGIQLLIQPYGKPLDTWKCASQGESLLCAEFWVHSDWGWSHIPQVASAAHKLGRKMVYAEGFTCTPLIAWKDDPQSLKPFADRAFCLGVNRLMLHAGAQNPWPQAVPGMTFGKWGTQFTPGQTWWRSGGAKELFSYFSRCQVLLQQGDYVDDFKSGGKSLTADFEGLRWIHRKTSEGDLFFIANPSDSAFSTVVSLAMDGRAPELWHPDTGLIENAVSWQFGSGTTQIDLSLDPYESLFVVLRKETSAKRMHRPADSPNIITTMNLSRGWKLDFPEGWGAPESILLDSLTSWSDSGDEGVRYFSGTARYSKNLHIIKKDARAHYILNLGQVKNLARVRVNGHEVAHLWKKPFLCDISRWLVKGNNSLEIDVTNLWVNRMIGDEQLPDDMLWSEPFHYQYAPGNPAVGRFLREVPEWLSQGMPRPSKGRHTIVSFKFFEKDDSLMPSGLLGPVILNAVFY